MKSTKSFSQRTVKATDPEVYDMMMNEALSTIKDIDQIIDLSNAEQFCSIIRYTEILKTPESAKEEFYYIKGIRHTCKECVLFCPAKDGRVKWTQCEHADISYIKADLPCCEFFYEKMKAGESLLKGAKE